MRIAEIFRSIQGEGRNQGASCTFVRMAGCNLRCSWCDTGYALAGGTEMSESEVAAAVRRLPGRYVCITGGEPLLQETGLIRVLRLLSGTGYTIDIETNGTIYFREVQQYASICMDVKCPSSGERSDLALIEYLRNEDSVKFVVSNEADCRYAEGIMRTYPIIAQRFVSPVYGSDYRMIAGFFLDNDLPARLQLQLHKMIGVR